MLPCSETSIRVFVAPKFCLAQLAYLPSIPTEQCPILEQEIASIDEFDVI